MFNRLFLKVFLFLALACFGVSAFATTYKYYRYGSNQCTLDKEAVCSNALNNIKAPYSGNSSVSITQNSCTDDSSSVYLSYKYARVNWIDGSLYDIDNRNMGAGEVLNHVCSDGEKFELIGCTAQCVSDPCNSLKDTEESAIVSCGSASCPSGSVFQCSGGSCACSGGNKALFIAQPLPITSINGCSAVLKPQTIVPNSGKVKLSAAGSSSTGGYCTATFTHQGVSTPQTDTPTNLLSLAFTGADYPDANGDCSDPAKPIKSTLNGQTVCYPNDGGGNGCPVEGEKPNSNGVCVGPDDPTYPSDTDPNKDPKDAEPNTCPKGQIKNNSGVCVPYGDATECPTGQVRNNMGLCGADPNANKCPTGQVKNAQGVCANDPRGTGCNDNSLPNSNGICANGTAACGVGQTRNAQGVCASASSGTGCKDGSTANSSGICADGSASCPVGKVRNNSGACVADTTNPDNKTSASLATDCVTAPACDGDPIQCAIYNAQWRNNCEATRAPNENEKAAVRGAIDDTNAQMDAIENEYKQSVDSIISGSGLLNNPVPTTSSCIPDKQIVIVNGLSVTVPYSLLCPYFSLLRSMLILVAYLFAARIVYAELTGGGIRV